MSDLVRPTEPSPETLRLVNAEISARAARLDANTARLDTKGTALLGFILAASTFLATQSIGGWWKVAPYAAFVAAAVYGIQSMRPRLFRDAPEPAVLLKDVGNRSETAALALFAKAKISAFEANRATHAQKATSWRRCLIALTAAVALMIAVLILGGQGGPSGGLNSPPEPAPASVPASAPRTAP